MSSRPPRNAPRPAITPFSVVEEPLAERDVPVLAVAGELDLFTAAELREALRAQIEQAPGDLLVDLSGCDFIDASGCRVLLSAARRLERHGDRLAIVGPRGAAARAFAVMGLDELFPVAETRAAAVAALRAPAR